MLLWGGIASQVLLAPLLLQSGKKKSPLYRVAGVPGKPSNYGSECQWDTGGVLTASAKMCVRGAGKEGK